MFVASTSRSITKWYPDQTSWLWCEIYGYQSPHRLWFHPSIYHLPRIPFTRTSSPKVWTQTWMTPAIDPPDGNACTWSGLAFASANVHEPRSGRAAPVICARDHHGPRSDRSALPLASSFDALLPTEYSSLVIGQIRADGALSLSFGARVPGESGCHSSLAIVLPFRFGDLRLSGGHVVMYDVRLPIAVSSSFLGRGCLCNSGSE